MCISTAALADGSASGGTAGSPTVVDLNVGGNGSGTLTLNDGGYFRIIDGGSGPRAVEIECTGANTIVTIVGIDVNVSAQSDRCALSFTGANNELLLSGTSSFASGEDEPGIRVETSTTLTINDSADTGIGELSAQGGQNGAGIGGGTGGNITISGGTITKAQGGKSGAGIGGGSFGNGGTITISGGTITEALCGDDGSGCYGGAGIGGGNLYDSGDITIDGTAQIGTAQGGAQAAGIGGGYKGDGGNITIDGSSQIGTAQGGVYAAGIGGGREGNGSGSGVDDSIDIKGGTITKA